VIFNGIEYEIIGTSIAYESGIEWKNASGRIFGIDYGINTDHVSTCINVHGNTEAILNLKKIIDECCLVDRDVNLYFTRGELPFGPLYDCPNTSTLLAVGSSSLKTNDKGCAEYEFTFVASGTDFQFKYNSLPMDIGNLAVQGVSRENTPDSNKVMLINDWIAHAHQWTDKRLFLTLSGSCDKLGGTLRWLIERRTQTFKLTCRNSMLLIDGQTSENLVFLAFGNLKRVGNSGFWEVDLSLAEAPA